MASTIKKIEQLDLSKQYSYADYLSWEFKERVELFKGWVKKMSPAPSRRHQMIVNRINVPLYLFLEGQQCEVYPAPFDVVLTAKGVDTVIQPDLSVIFELEELTDQGCTGGPDLIVEVLSSGNSSKEKKDKFELYQENGVGEYWLVDPGADTIYVYQLDENGKYIGLPPHINGMRLESKVLKGFSLEISEVFK